MKYILRGNDIAITWNLKDYSTWEPINVPQGISKFYVYSKDIRLNIENFSISSSILTSTIAGNLLPSGIYTLELVWNNNGVWGRTISMKAFCITEGYENADRIDTDSTTSLWQLLSSSTDEQINPSHLKDFKKTISVGVGSDIYVIGQDDDTPSSWSNVYSAKKCDELFSGGGSGTGSNYFTESKTGTTINFITPKYPFEKLVINDSITIGGIKLTYDSALDALRIDSTDSTKTGNVYSTGGMSAYGGGNSSGTTTGLDATKLWQEMADDGTEQIALNHLTTALNWTNISNKPTTLASLGITSIDWSLIANHPTTIAGYGITDAGTGGGTTGSYLPLAGGTLSGAVKFGSDTYYVDATGNGVFNTLSASSLDIGNYRLVADTANNAIKVVNKDGSTAVNFYATGGVSAYGGGTSSGTTTNMTVLGSSSFGGTFDDSVLTNTFNAYSINNLYSRLVILENGKDTIASANTLGKIKIGSNLTIAEDGTLSATASGGGTSGTTTNSLTIQANGTSLGTFDGSSAVSVNLTYANVGAASSSHTHDGIPTSTQISNWNSAYTNSHSHSNLSVLNGISSTDTSNWDSAYSDSHSHSNISTLNGITSTNVANWTSAYTNSHTHSNKSYLDAINQSLSTTSSVTFASVLSTGGVTAYTSSDRRLKENIKGFNAVELIHSLGGVYSFDYIGGKHSYGFIAQNLLNSDFRDMVGMDDTGYYNVNYLDTRLISIALKGVVEIDDKINNLEARLSTMEARL